MSSRFAWLDSLADRSRERYAVAKTDLETKLERAVEKKAAKGDDEKKLRAWGKTVRNRDGYKDRHTKRKVLSTRQLDPDRAEAHHHEPRENYDVRYDTRNGICLSFATHQAVERHELAIVGDHYYTVKGRRYLNVAKPVRFVPA